MAFKKNSKQQIRIDDPFFGLTAREKKYLEKSWADTFLKTVFPAINEERFEVLYSSNPASRPNTPVNVIIGALMLKELFRLSDEELIERMLFDVLFQHALGTTSFEEQPVSDRTFGRFRERVYNYELQTGRDLIQEEMESLSEIFISFSGVSKSMRRMDSVMVSSSCKKMSRLSILYSSVRGMVNRLEKESEEISPALNHYLDGYDENIMLYHRRSEDINSRLEEVLRDATKLVESVPDSLYESNEFRLLERVLNEQTDETSQGRVLKEGKDISPDSLQSVSDPDASYRKKAGKAYIGYVANFVETCSEDGPHFITNYSFKPNTHSDHSFTQEVLETLGVCKEELILLADGAYGSEDAKSRAKTQNIRLITTSLCGKSPHPKKADFQIDHENKKLLLCPGGQVPLSTSYYEKTDIYRGVFDKEFCSSCPYRQVCGMKEQKKSNAVVVTPKLIERARSVVEMGSEDFKKLARKRNGVEGIPSVLRRRYGIDSLPVRGLLRSKIWLGFKVGAINVKRLLKSVRLEESLA